jgi:hypothetical protein
MIGRILVKRIPSGASLTLTSLPNKRVLSILRQKRNDIAALGCRRWARCQLIIRGRTHESGAARTTTAVGASAFESLALCSAQNGGASQTRDSCKATMKPWRTILLLQLVDSGFATMDNCLFDRCQLLLLVGQRGQDLVVAKPDWLIIATRTISLYDWLRWGRIPAGFVQICPPPARPGPLPLRAIS